MRLTRRALLLGAAGLAAWPAQSQETGGAPLRLLSWPETHDPATLLAFAEVFGRGVEVVAVGEEQEAVARLREGPARYDLALLGDDALARALDEGLLQPLDSALLPSLATGALPMRFLQRSLRDGQLSALPWAWGWLGIVWNSALSPGEPGRWSDLWRLGAGPLRGKLMLPDDPVVTPGTALKSLGYAWDSENGLALLAADALLRRARRDLFAVSSDMQLPLMTDDAAVAPAWSHEARALCRADPRFRAVLPRDGGLLWVDSLAVPAWAPDPLASHALLAWLTDPATAARDMTFSGLAPCDARVGALLPRELAEDPLLFPGSALVVASDFVPPALGHDPARRAMLARLKGA